MKIFGEVIKFKIRFIFNHYCLLSYFKKNKKIDEKRRDADVRTCVTDLYTDGRRTDLAKVIYIMLYIQKLELKGLLF